MKFLRIPMFAVAFLLAGCSIIEAGSAKRVEGVEGKKLEDGSWYLYDTQSHRAEFQRMMDMHIEGEKSGGTPYHGRDTSWDEFWMSRIRVLTPDRQENSSEYIDYIIDARRQAGLPDLHDYPSR